MSAIGVALIAVLGGGKIAGASSSSGVTASYDGSTINLADGRDGATVCAVTATGTDCFSSQADYQSWLALTEAAADVSPITDVSPAPDVNCSSAFELFSGTGYSGTELSVLDEAVWINLSTYGMADAVNSYKVGACESSATSGTNGSGDVYPGPMTAGSEASSMESGWANRLESVYVL